MLNLTPSPVTKCAKLNLCVTKITLNYANGRNSWLVINDLPYNRQIVQLLMTCVVARYCLV